MAANSKIFIGIALLGTGLWLTASYGADYLAGGHFRQAMKKHAVPAELPVEIETLRQKVKANPADSKSALELARKYHQEAALRKDGQLLLSAVQAYSEILRVEPKNKAALYELGMLTFDQGLLNKGIEYLGRYLAIQPNDLRAQTNFALAKVQNNQAEEAIPVLVSVVEKTPDLFPPHFALALAYRVSGQKEDAKKMANKALELAPDKTAETKVRTFIASLNESSQTKPPTTNLASAVESYFKNHQIVGPKLRGFNWLSSKLVHISLADFPVDAMPPVAKQSFVAKIKAQFANYNQPLKIVFVDAANSKELMAVEL